MSRYPFLIEIEKQIRKKLSDDQSNEQLITRLAENYLQQGRLEEARKLFKQLSKTGSYPLSSLYTGELKNYQLDEFLIPQVRLVPDFLNETELAEIWNEVFSLEQFFSPARVHDKVDENLRSAKVIFEKKIPQSSKILKRKLNELITKNKDYKNLLKLDVFNSQLHLSRHLNQDFLSKHRDNDGNSTESKREWTYIYYFFKEPKAFTGGELLIYHTNPINHNFVQSFTRIIPKNNLLILFPSDFFHEVNQIKMESETPIKGRYTLNGWLSP